MVVTLKALVGIAEVCADIHVGTATGYVKGITEKHLAAWPTS